MKKASLQLSPVNSSPEGYPIYFLTGKNYLFQTLFCIQSLITVTKTKFRFILIDDGSFNKRIIKQIRLQLPGAEVVTQQMIEQNLKKVLPSQLFPHLHYKRKVYPHIKKLTDIHTLSGNPWKLVLDSDMLFLKEPQKIIDWLSKPLQPLHMIDCEESYGYSKDLMGDLTQCKITSLINVGAIGLNSHHINWNHLEIWTKTLEEKEGGCYYLEQALTAMIIGERRAVVLNNQDYIVNPTSEDTLQQRGILHHYVDLSKEGYFTKGWKNIFKKENVITNKTKN